MASLPSATEVHDADYLILDQEDGTKKIPIEDFLTGNDWVCY